MEPRVTGVYMVGGAIRDEILGVPNKDVDFSVEAERYEDMRDFVLQRGEIFKEDPEFVTLRAHVNDLSGISGDFDFVLCRREGAYSDGRRPDWVERGTIYDDLARRDFTINAVARLFYPVISDQYLDPFGGIQDIKNGRIRCVGKAEDRMREDSLRMLRAVRFAVTKEMRFDREIGEVLQDARYLSDLKNNVSMSRKYEEIEKMFKYNTLESLRILSAFPGLAESVFGDNVLWLRPTNKRRGTE